MSHLDILNCLGVTDECDGQTDFIAANAELHYAAQPKNEQ